MDLRQGQKVDRLQSQRGFTLLEIVFAIMLLGGSLVVLLGLQSSAVQRALRDRDQQTAMLVARSIFSGIEVQTDTVEVQDITEPAEKTLRKFVPQYQPSDEDREIIKKLEVRMAVEEVTLPLGPDTILSLKRINFRIFWGDGPDDHLDILYFLPED